MVDETAKIPSGVEASAAQTKAQTAAQLLPDRTEKEPWVWPLAIGILVFIVGFAILTSLRSGPVESESAQNDNLQEVLGGMPLAPDEIFARCSPSVAQVLLKGRDDRIIGTGSAFLVDRTGLFATNYHVIERAYSAEIVFADSRRSSVIGVAGVDETADIAIVKVPVYAVLDLTPLVLASDELPVGAKVYAIGNPLGLANSLSDGLVSGYREFDGVGVIQTTAAIGPGSSGGPLLAPDGRAVGVTSSGLKNSQNLNFAVPVAKVRKLLQTQSPMRSLPLPSALLNDLRVAEQQRIKEEQLAKIRKYEDRVARNRKRIGEMREAIEAVDEAIPLWAAESWRSETNMYRLGKMPSEFARDRLFELIIKMRMNEKDRVRSLELGAARSGLSVRAHCERNHYPLPQDYDGGSWKQLRDCLAALEFN